MTTWWEWALAWLAALMVGLSKTGVAGLGVLSVAIYATVLPPKESLGAVLVSLLAGDVVAVRAYFRDVKWLHIGRLLPPAAIGVFLGALMLGRINDSQLRSLIGWVLVLLVSATYLRKWLSRTTSDSLQEPLVTRYRWLGWLTGLAAGFFTMVANASGPIMILYLLSLRLPKRQFIGTSAIFFFAINLVKVPFSIWLNLINSRSLQISLLLIPCTVIGALIGRWLLPKINQSLFEQTALLLTLVAAGRLLWG